MNIPAIIRERPGFWVAGAALVLLVALSSVSSTCSSCADRRVDERDAELMAEIEALKTQVAERDGELRANAAAIAAVDERLREAGDRIATLEGEARKQDEKLTTTRSTLARARSSRAPALSDDELDARLRALYPD